jgi:hypothetical protein
MQLLPIDRRSNLSREEFIENYLKPKRPVVFTDLAKDWPALNKWTFEWLRDNHGDLEVPLFDNNVHNSKSYYQAAKTMRFGDYLSLIEKGPSDLRIFLFDIFKKAPELKSDIRFPTIMDGFLKSYKFMFFGGQNSVVNLHYDMDCSHVFLTQFQTRKQIILFSPEDSEKIYHHPYTVQSHIDPLKPDYEKFPALKNVKGYEAVIGHGETIFMPSLWWHYIKYVDGGFSVALRANDSVFTQVRGGYNLVRHTVIDKGMNFLMGENWKKWKEKKAIENAQEALKEEA